MDRERLKQVLEELRERYEEDWNRSKDQVLESLKQISEILLREDMLKLEDIEQIDRIKKENIPPEFRKLFNLWFYRKDKINNVEFYNHEKIKKLLKVTAETNDSNFKIKLTEIVDIMNKIIEDQSIKNAGIPTLSSLIAVVNPTMLMPTTDSSINKQFKSNFNIEIRSPEEYSELIKTIRKIANAFGIDNMLEVAFYLSKYEGKDRNNDGINDIKKKIDNLLNAKKQIILYGPPGTGKTWLAKNFVKENAPKTYKIAKRDILENVKFFWWSINPSKWDHTQLEEGRLVEMWYGQWKRAFEEISNGDIVFIYVGGKIGRIYAVGTYGEKDGKPHVKVQKILDGPSWRSLKDDPVLGNSLPVKMGARGTLFPLNSDEGLRICKLSNLKLSELGLSLEESYEEIESTVFVTFHPSYAYEEFVEGLRPKTDEEGRIIYKVEEGIFKRICRNAYNALLNHAGVEKEWKEGEDLPTLTEDELNKVKNSLTDAPKFYLIVDEINRGDISRIFGELITLLEADKRLFVENELTVTLPYSKTKFGIPPNLYIIGTMNTADRSIALIDVALRRRFGFIELMPDYEVLEKELLDGKEDEAKDIKELAISVLRALNEKIGKLYDRDHQIGHSYFLKLKDCKSRKDAIEMLKQIWFFEVIPLLQEYFYDSPKKLKDVAGDFIELDSDSQSYEFRKMDEFDDNEFISALKKIAGERSG
ncbi:GTPase subunit of restriction endonuclease [Archaeoglobus fulgidus DSM 8774]|uniref:GTPase subunit of restriction endonuclease n=1 Tax=Archaeoglobus fulgidus DSM 8774 TaxID=1344584 RepID=A0A075WIJ8_ARCFL|nr:AAA family ATPase [Archaeoglobus fulgidus]AIG97413.1 GTPase subunit of restriction endonuclease [Archaeoglobus fulgidus DSM 8774]